MPADETSPFGISQTGNVAGGHLAGRDVNIIESRSRPTHMGGLIESFRRQREQNEVLDGFIESLDLFVHQIETETEPRGLEAKLSDAGRSSEVMMAERLKELFHKKLTLYQLTPAAQEIFAVALGKVFVNFQAQVKPLLAARASTHQIEDALLRHVIEPVYRELEDNPMNLAEHEVKGMVYYLTGNCHLVWV